MARLDAETAFPQEKRKLAAIVCADVVGYAKHMQRDESGTHARIKTLGTDVIRRFTENRNGRLVKTMGDGFLMDFDSVSDAFAASVSIQEYMIEQNIESSDGVEVQFRIGLHIGDVIVDGSDIFGDGVIIASRLESLADPCGILASQAAYEQLKGAQSEGLVSMGKVELKNIDRRVEVWQWSPFDGGKYSQFAGNLAPPRSSKPAVAVMRFQNLSNDVEQEYFVSGICEDLQSTLSKSRLFDVIARNSSFSFDPQAVNPQQVGRSLNVRYIVQGSVRKAGNRVRVSTSVVDTDFAKEIWSDHFDGDLDDIFDLQDRMASSLSSAIIPEITRAEIERTKTIRVGDLSAWDHYLQAIPLMQRMTEIANREAISHLKTATDNQQDFSSALAMLSRCRVTAAYQLWGEGAEKEHMMAVDASKQAVTVDPENPLAYDARSAAHVYAREFDEAILSARKAIELDPSLASAYGSLAAALAFSGRSEEAFEVCLAADHISPRDPDRSQRQMALILATFVNEDFQATKTECQKYILIKPNWFGVYPFLAASCAFLGQRGEAERAIERLLEILPGYTVGQHAKRIWFKREEDRARLLEGLARAGLPT